ncbi:MAG: 6-carboxytetrahydropterin synthase [Planctomycetaceae bacterium]|nr:6-carboxytetrahydropterin synthase [Planctomycetaceae bacterium]
MFTISRQFTFCYAHRLRRHAGKCANLHGHNGTAKIDLQNGQLNQQGMVVDFIEVKNLLGNWIDEHLDHRTILEEGDPLAAILMEQGELVLTLPTEPTAENLAKLIYDQAERFGLPVVSVSVWETEKCAAAYRAP